MGCRCIDRATLAEWQREADRHTLYVMDVRDPAEYRAGHLPGSVMAPGGQLVQETDSWLGVWGARVVLVDDTGVRARMTASWLRRMGWDAVVLDGGLDGAETGARHAGGEERHLPARRPRAGRPSSRRSCRRTRPSLSTWRSADTTGRATSRAPGSRSAPGSPRRSTSLPAQGELVLTSEDGRIARFAAAELRTRRPVKVLAGGTAAWKAAGLPLETGMGPLASEPDDVSVSARDRPPAEHERYMREYLAWEIDLVNQIARDPDCRFRLAPVK